MKTKREKNRNAIRRMSKKSRSYTVAFGDLEISVSTASVDTSEEVIGVPKPVGRKDEALTRALEVARKKESLKRVVKDDEYFDSLHANAVQISATTERKTTKATSATTAANRQEQERHRRRRFQ